MTEHKDGYYLSFTNTNKDWSAKSVSYWHPNLKSAECGKAQLEKSGNACDIKITKAE